MDDSWAKKQYITVILRHLSYNEDPMLCVAMQQKTIIFFHKYRSQFLSCKTCYPITLQQVYQTVVSWLHVTAK